MLDTRRFAWVDLGCALAAGALWYISDGRLGPWPLLIAGIPWVARVAGGRFPVRRTQFDLLLWAFLASAILAALIAYNPALAADKLWLIIGAAAIFYALAGQRSANIWPIVYGTGAFAVAVAVYFLLTHDWQVLPAKIGFVNDMALQWMRLRPDWFSSAHQLHPNVAGGIMAMLFPLALAGGIRATRDWHRAAMFIAAGGGFLLSASLVLTTSRGAWLALVFGLVAWVLWIGAGRLTERLYLSRRQTLALLFLVLGGIGLTLILLSPGGLVGVLDRLPGPANAGSRLSVSRDAIDMIGDSPVIGAGLGAFDGLYSQYIRVIPTHFMIHGHNFFLNVGVEQGLVGLALVLGMLVLAFWWLADPQQSNPRHTLHQRSLLAGALFASLVVLCVHGLVEDPLYGSRAVLLLWLPLGLTAFLFPRRAAKASAAADRRPAIVVAGVLLVLGVTLALVYRTSLAATYHSSRGVLEMARVELAGYPTNRWSDGREATDLTGAAARFQRAIELDATNRPAWHRLGLIAMLRRDYEAAVASLSQAHQLDPGHSGIRKALAYADIWSGRQEEGVLLLSDLPEAQSELDAYQWWWNEQGEPELSIRAAAALEALRAAANP